MPLPSGRSAPRRPCSIHLWLLLGCGGVGVGWGDLGLTRGVGADTVALGYGRDGRMTWVGWRMTRKEGWY